MIFFGNDTNNSKLKYGVRVSKKKNDIDEKFKLNHYYLTMYFGKKRYWIGYNRLKRVVKDKQYKIDGKSLHYDGEILSRKRHS